MIHLPCTSCEVRSANCAYAEKKIRIISLQGYLTNCIRICKEAVSLRSLMRHFHRAHIDASLREFKERKFDAAALV
jgi:hypothetical protein